MTALRSLLSLALAGLCLCGQASAADIRVIDTATPTATGTQDYTISGFGTPKAVAVIYCYGATHGTSEATARFGYGFTDGTRQRSVGVYAADTSSAATRRVASDSSVVSMIATTAVATAAFDSWVTDGVRLNWTVAPPTARRMIVVLFGGSDLSAYVGTAALGTGTTAVNVTDPGFQAKLVFAGGVGEAVPFAIANSSIFSLGVAAPGVAQRGFGYRSGNLANPSQTSAILWNDAAGGQIADASVTYKVALGSHASGFTTTSNVSAGSDGLAYLALTMDNDVWVGSLTPPTATGSPWSVTSPGWQPQFAMTFGTTLAAEGTQANDTTAGAFGVGAADGTTEVSVGISERDNVATFDTSSLSAAKFARFDNGLGAAAHDMSGLSFTGTGFDVATVTTADATQRRWFGLAVSGESDATPPTVNSARIPATGDEVTFTHSEPVEDAGSFAGYALSLSGGAVTLSNPTTDGNDLTFDLSRTVGGTETGSASYTAGTVEDAAGNALATDASIDLDNDSYQGTLPFPVIAPEAAVGDLDATKQSFSVDVAVTNGKRYAFGVAALGTDDGDVADFTVEGVSVGTVTLEKDRLANIESSYFEDGLTWQASSTGTVTVGVSVSSGTWEVKGFVAREADAASGCVEDQGTATHCSPLECLYGGARYRIHSEMYSGAMYLSRNGTPLGKAFDGISTDRNERYHNGGFVLPLSGGVVVGQVGHNESRVRVKYLPAGDFGSISSSQSLGDSGLSLTYAFTAVGEGDVVYLLTRAGSGADEFALLMTLSDLPLVGSGGATATEDFLFSEGRPYPRGLHLVNDGDEDAVVCLFNTRSGADWETVVAAAYFPGQGAAGEWYGPNGAAATVNNALGTALAPRLDSTAATTAVGSGGFRVLPAVGSAQRYVPPASVADVTQWAASGVTAGKFSILFPYVDKAGGSTAYGTSAVKFCLQAEGTQTLTDDAIVSDANSYRVEGAARWKDDDRATDTAYFILTDRGTRAATNRYGETTDLYYDWGSAASLKVIEVTTPLTAGTLAFSQHSSVDVSADGYTAMSVGLVAGDPSRVLYQRATNELHPTHRQAAIGSVSVPSSSSPASPRGPGKLSIGIGIGLGAIERAKGDGELAAVRRDRDYRLAF